MKKQTISIMMAMAFLIVIMPLVIAQSQPVYKQGTAINLKIPCLNNGTYCSESATCNATILGPLGGIIKNNEVMTQNNSIFNITLSANDTETLGQYEFTPCCNDDSSTECSSLVFLITKTGNEIKTSESIIYVVFLLTLLFVFILTLYGAIKIPFRNKRDDDGNIVGVNDIKYLKVACIVFSYVLFLFLVGVVKSIMENYLYINGAYRVFNLLFWIMFSFLWPLVVLSFLFSLIMIVNSAKIKKVIKRGVPLR